MFIKVSVPGQFRLKMMPSFRSFLMHRDGEVHYIGGTDILPAPFDSVREAEVLRKFGTSEDKEARSALIEHNLRLVVYIARKFDNTSVGVEDLISIGTIGLIKAINTFDVDKNIKLATYASRCIENEILMYLRRNNKTKLEVSIDEPLNVDWDGNELLLSDILGTDEDIIYRDLEDETERKLLNAAIDRLNPREQKIVKLRFGLGREQEDEMTQKEVADLLGISQSYISRLEKKIMKRLKKFRSNAVYTPADKCWKKQTDQDVKRTHFIAEGDREVGERFRYFLQNEAGIGKIDQLEQREMNRHNVKGMAS